MRCVYTLLKSSLWRYFAEFVGTFILVIFGDGAIVASTLTGQPNFGIKLERLTLEESIFMFTEFRTS